MGDSPPADHGPPRSAGPRSPAPPEAPAEVTAPLPVLAASAGPAARLLDRWVPSAWRGARLDPGRPGAVALVVVAAVAAVVAAVGVWRERPVAEPAPAPAPMVAARSSETPPSGANPAAAATAASPVPSARLVVSVAGKVRHPGLVRLPDGARVADAVAAAGGPAPNADLTTLNLARRLADGEQVLVGLPPPPGAAEPGPAETPGPLGQPGGRLDLNTASLEQLDMLPGVGPVTAQRILDWRAQHGRFTSVDQLREIDGIGERRFGQLRDRVTV